MAGTQKEKLLRKLDIAESLIIEAKSLVHKSEMEGSKIPKQFLEMVETQSELLNVMLEQMAEGKIKMDKEIDSRFLHLTKKLLQLKKAEHLDRIRGKYYGKDE